MRSSHEAPQNQDIADFLSQFPEKTDLRDAEVMQGVRTVLGTQGFTGITISPTAITGYFGGHVFTLSQDAETGGLATAYVTSAYDNAVHHTGDIPVAHFKTMTFWEYLWDLGRILNRSLELESNERSHNTDHSVHSLRLLALGETTDPVSMYLLSSGGSAYYRDSSFEHYLPPCVMNQLSE